MVESKKALPKEPRSFNGGMGSYFYPSSSSMIGGHQNNYYSTNGLHNGYHRYKHTSSANGDLKSWSCKNYLFTFDLNCDFFLH